MESTSPDDFAATATAATASTSLLQATHQSSFSSESSFVIAPSRTSTSSNRDSLSLRPTFMEKFRPPVATKFMQQILQSQLQNKIYHADEAQKLSKIIAEDIKAKLIGKYFLNTEYRRPNATAH
ncbi:hypothetical protein BGZ54_001025 [Gamsiella multidivaricata]|nr:hypothetical protein BGZ54_001025 [Gamsiella multidivaricata]